MIRVTEDQHKWLLASAKMHGLTLSNYVRERLQLPKQTSGTRNDLPPKSEQPGR